jgi:signal transduction histidine kinase
MSTAPNQSNAAPMSNEALARKIHDDVSQKLTVLGLQLAVMEATTDKSNPLAPKITELSKLTTEVALAVREVMEALSPKRK